MLLQMLKRVSRGRRRNGALLRVFPTRLIEVLLVVIDSLARTGVVCRGPVQRELIRGYCRAMGCHSLPDEFFGSLDNSGVRRIGGGRDRIGHPRQV
jgi:hypothetical protein